MNQDTNPIMCSRPEIPHQEISKSTNPGSKGRRPNMQTQDENPRTTYPSNKKFPIKEISFSEKVSKGPPTGKGKGIIKETIPGPNRAAVKKEHWVVIGSCNKKEIRRELINHSHAQTPNLMQGMFSDHHSDLCTVNGRLGY